MANVNEPVAGTPLKRGEDPDEDLDDTAGVADFKGLRVLSLESRRAGEMACLIERWGGIATVVPAMREIALPRNPHLPIFETALRQNTLDITIWTTGVGTRMMLEQIGARWTREALAAGINRTVVVARGPKPTLALREIGVAASVVVPHPNTWREVLAVFERRRNARPPVRAQTPDFLAANAANAATAANATTQANGAVVFGAASQAANGSASAGSNVDSRVLVPLLGRRVALQEYGVPNRALARELASRGASVMRVPVYRWSLPEDVGPLLRATQDIIENRFDVALFTTGTQVWHLFKLAYKKGMEDELRDGLARLVLVSVGPTTSEALREFELPVDLEPEHPKMGHLVKAAATHAHALLQLKRDSHK